jgi:hypothetical protein
MIEKWLTPRRLDGVLCPDPPDGSGTDQWPAKGLKFHPEAGLAARG